MSTLDTPIEYLKGVGPNRAELLKKEVGIFTFTHLLHHFPFRYVDRSQFSTVAQIVADGNYVQVVGQLSGVQELGKPRQKRVVAQLNDATGSVELVWFKGAKWILPSLKPGVEYVVYGKPSVFNGKINIAHPEIEVLSKAREKTTAALQPVYSTTEKLSAKGLNSKGLEKLQRALVTEVLPAIEENLPESVLSTYKLMDRALAFQHIHFPDGPDWLRAAQFRLKFEELFFVQLQILRLKLNRQVNTVGYEFGEVGAYFNRFYEEVLPFELTGAQKRVIREIRKDVGSGKQMNRLLQGDVGSGKTIVALMVMLLAIDNGFQATLMAPTEILARQHYHDISAMAEQIGLKVELLTGSVPQQERKGIHERLESGKAHIIVGTHALLEDKVRFKALGLTVIDEQHRFGVAQRSRMWQKHAVPPHVLVMSATPIPRTLAMTLYGDLDVSTIDELPPGRKPIQTQHLRDRDRLRVFGFMREQIQLGRQVYVVYPLIQESEKMDYKDLMDGFESVSRAFPLPDYRVAIVHGKMKPADKDYEMEHFVSGHAQIMVATTVIEVGVNVPNASVMVIESAERFGLSQLHQLRGRVGRGADQSYCLLVTSDKLSSDARVRMETMTGTTDGFAVAEADLKLRGPGDLMGTQQSGTLNLRLADLGTDGKILQLARQCAYELLRQDPNLANTENLRTREFYQEYVQKTRNWSQIS